MTENQGERPADPAPETPADTAQPADAVQPAAEAPQALQASQTPSVPQAPSAPQAPAGQAPAWQPPHPGARPAGYPAYPQQAQQPYGAPRPQGYAGQPAPAPQYSSAFGAAGAPRPELNQTQPTVPFDRSATGTVPTTTAAPRKKSGAGKVVGLIVAAAIVGGAAGLGGAYAGVNLFSPAGTSPAAGPSTVTVNNDDSVNQTTAIAAKVTPSVVTISATGGNSGGTGSGVVLTEDGYVVTNTHVVTLDGATADATIRVTTSDGQVYDAEVVGTDPTYDLAVIKLVDASGLTPIEFADSSELNVGDETIAVGAPLGLSNTVTTGIVSALNRSIQIASSAAPDSSDSDADQAPEQENGDNGPFTFDFGQGQTSTPSASISIAVIQTDAAINPGNSGGALVDGDGKLIGVNVAIATAGGTGDGGSGSIGVGFSIPSNIVQRVTDEIIDTGAATHGLLGASVQDAASAEGSTTTGALIAELVDGGAAQAGGLQVGDVVTAFNAVPVTDATDLTAQVRAAAAGSDATVTLVRDGKTQTIDVTLGELAQ
ncbi:S1C family serine protease [Microbacterium pygmaeum]|uniref:Putative serine protease PepD n=1 Tax=Microbacterium pygmaeum TaxID=370764 RepID=A0A1G7ZKB4_9MICO|nr:trypsin-like peptidase domain-containing protein [Microbacterium pygmaeum]SDH09055.1 putative serine protease PepD [Microbacterium pygmaeum]